MGSLDWHRTRVQRGCDPLPDPAALNEHWFRTPGDFYLKRSEQHVHHSADHPGSDANRRLTDVAVQFQLGILPKRRFRLDLDHCVGVGLGGPRIAAQGSEGGEARKIRIRGTCANGCRRCSRPSKSGTGHDVALFWARPEFVESGGLHSVLARTRSPRSASSIARRSSSELESFRLSSTIRC